MFIVFAVCFNTKILSDEHRSFCVIDFDMLKKNKTFSWRNFEPPKIMHVSSHSGRSMNEYPKWHSLTRLLNNLVSFRFLLSDFIWFWNILTTNYLFFTLKKTDKKVDDIPNKIFISPSTSSQYHISIYHFHKIWGFRGENLLETLLNYKSKRNTLTKGYETNPSTGHADALHMRGNLIIPLYLKSKNQFPLTYYIATSYDICLMLIWMTRE